MFKNVSMLEVKGNARRVYNLYYQPDAPLGEINDALSQMKLHVIDRMRIQEMKQQSEKQGIK